MCSATVVLNSETITEERKAKNREKMRRFRLRHKDDPVYKERAREEKRKQLAKNPERRKEGSRRRQNRYRQKVKTDPIFKAKAALRTRAWREKYPHLARNLNKAWAENNREKLLAYLRQYRANHPRESSEALKECWALHAAYRRARKKAAMPPWADRDAIAAVYREARIKSAETGIIWHVDHVVPLQHKLVCGLHIPLNLQLLPASENLGKHNRFTVS